MFGFQEEVKRQKLLLQQVWLSSCVGKEGLCLVLPSPSLTTQVCILHFCCTSTWAGNHCRVLQKAFDKDWSATGMERQRLLKKGETASRNWALPVQTPCPKAAARKHQLPHDCDRKTELPPLEDYSSIKLCGWDAFTKQEEHPFHPVEKEHTSSKSTSCTVWLKSRRVDQEQNLSLSAAPPAQEMLLAGCVLPGRPWIFVPWIHPKGWRCLHSHCWLAGSCGNYSSWYSLKRASPGQSYSKS